MEGKNNYVGRLIAQHKKYIKRHNIDIVEKEVLRKEILKLKEENNSLRKDRRIQLLIAKAPIISAGIALFAYIYIQHVVDKISESYQILFEIISILVLAILYFRIWRKLV